MEALPLDIWCDIFEYLTVAEIVMLRHTTQFAYTTITSLRCHTDHEIFLSAVQQKNEILGVVCKLYPIPANILSLIATTENVTIMQHFCMTGYKLSAPVLRIAAKSGCTKMVEFLFSVYCDWPMDLLHCAVSSINVETMDVVYMWIAARYSKVAIPFDIIRATVDAGRCAAFEWILKKEKVLDRDICAYLASSENNELFTLLLPTEYFTTYNRVFGYALQNKNRKLVQWFVDQHQSNGSTHYEAAKHFLTS
jgi:hypothetical protein